MRLAKFPRGSGVGGARMGNRGIMRPCLGAFCSVTDGIEPRLARGGGGWNRNPPPRAGTTHPPTATYPSSMPDLDACYRECGARKGVAPSLVLFWSCIKTMNSRAATTFRYPDYRQRPRRPDACAQSGIQQEGRTHHQKSVARRRQRLGAGRHCRNAVGRGFA